MASIYLVEASHTFFVHRDFLLLLNDVPDMENMILSVRPRSLY